MRDDKRLITGEKRPAARTFAPPPIGASRQTNACVLEDGSDLGAEANPGYASWGATPRAVVVLTDEKRVSRRADEACAGRRPSNDDTVQSRPTHARHLDIVHETTVDDHGPRPSLKMKRPRPSGIGSLSFRHVAFDRFSFFF